jgi:putative hydrolase of HD superfamily
VIEERLAQQLGFLLEADALKSVQRRTPITGGRMENSAEHSWHLALFALLLAEHSDEPLDVGHAILLALVHDLVEIDAGDTFAYDTAGYETKAARELEAAERLFSLLPADQALQLRGLWEEFDLCTTPEARFANALDRLQPALLNCATGGGSWIDAEVQREQVEQRMAPVGAASTALGAVIRERVAEGVDRGWIRP